jgi:hypothetical protein
LSNGRGIATGSKLLPAGSPGYRGMDMETWLARVVRRARPAMPRPVSAAVEGSKAVPKAVRAMYRAAGRLPRSALMVGAPVVTGLVVIAALAAGGVAARSSDAGPPAVRPVGTAGSTSPSVPAGLTGDFTGIVLPDLLIVAPNGLTGPDVAGLRAIRGVRKMLTFDGAQITLGGRPASVIGVNADRFRSWVPLRVATDQALWTRLADGEFIASQQAGTSFGLAAGRSYSLAARSAVEVRFAGSASLDIAGVDFLVNPSVSRSLGLVHRVAALISAPGSRIATLKAQVREMLGADASIVDLRGRRLPVATAQPAHITSYLQLFQASAARYCPALSWTILAAIGQIESADGQNMGPSSAGALGPMQFLPSTWAVWGIDGFGPAGPPDIMDPFDAVPSAARLLCADGASDGTQDGLRRAIFAYNHAEWYVNQVLALAARYAAEYH